MFDLNILEQPTGLNEMRGSKTGSDGIILSCATVFCEDDDC